MGLFFDKMRWGFASFILSLALTALSACQGSQEGYLANGPGSEVTASDIAQATNRQNIYFRELCRQSGASRDCSAIPAVDRTAWTIIVRQGMNDIDRRCDAYLQWLDDKKRSQAPLLSEVKDVNTATVAIVGAAAPSNALALQILAAAFNLVTRSIENYHSRLLLEIDSSTINSVVLRARNDFRTNTRSLYFDNRPDAEYALRSYLRLCLPFAIETNINNYTTLGAQGIPVSEQNSINTSPVQTIGSPLTFGSMQPPPPTTPVKMSLVGAVTPWEKQLLQPDLQRIQDYLCIGARNSFDDKTRTAISLWIEAKGFQGGSDLNGRNGASLLESAQGDGKCDISHYKNVYERVQLSTVAKEQKFIANLLKAMNQQPAALGSDARLPQARPMISQYLLAHPAYQRADLAPDEITPMMFKRIQNP